MVSDFTRQGQPGQSKQCSARYVFNSVLDEAVLPGHWSVLY